MLLPASREVTSQWHMPKSFCSWTSNERHCSDKWRHFSVARQVTQIRVHEKQHRPECSSSSLQCQNLERVCVCLPLSPPSIHSWLTNVRLVEEFPCLLLDQGSVRINTRRECTETTYYYVGLHRLFTVWTGDYTWESYEWWKGKRAERFTFSCTLEWKI